MSSPSTISEALLDQMEEAYQTGKGLPTLSREFGHSVGKIQWRLSNRLRSKGLSLRPLSITQKRNVSDDAVFRAPLTDAAIYWIGMLTADGWIYRTSGISCGVGLQLQYRDREHVRAFQKFLSTTTPLYDLERRSKRGVIRRYTRLLVSSRPMVRALADCGIVPRKTAITHATPDLALNRHFWRGEVDGDGSLRCDRYAQLSLVGSQELMEQFAVFCRAICPTSRISVRPTRRAFRVSMRASTATSVITELYRDTDLALARKLATARAVMDQGFPMHRWHRVMEAAA